MNIGTQLTPGTDPFLVAAVAAAVAFAAGDQEYQPTAFAKEPAAARGTARGASGWKLSGRWQAISSRLSVDPRRAANRRW